MIKILSLIFAGTLKGTVDQINNNTVSVELVAKDGHTHEVEFPIWVFPCSVKEGTIFFVDTFDDATVIRCKE